MKGNVFWLQSVRFKISRGRFCGVFFTGLHFEDGPLFSIQLLKDHYTFWGFVSRFWTVRMFRDHVSKVITSLDAVSQDAAGAEFWRTLVLGDGKVPWIPATLDCTVCACALTCLSLWRPVWLLDHVRTCLQIEICCSGCVMEGPHNDRNPDMQDWTHSPKPPLEKHQKLSLLLLLFRKFFVFIFNAF